MTVELPQQNGRVTVVIPTYNRATLLARALHSVLNQTAADCCDIVVSDDGSTDRTPPVAASFGDRIHYIRQANAGVSAARNAGIRARPNEFVAFLDSDDAWETDKIERQLEMFRQYPQALLVSGRVTRNYADGRQELSPPPVVPLNVLTDLAPPLFEDNSLPTSATIVRAAALADAEWFRPDLPICQDYHLWVRVACRGPGVFLDAPLARYTVAAPHSLAADPVRLLMDELRARYFLRNELRQRPDCRPHWRRGLAACLARLRDQTWQRGDFGAAARYGFRSLVRQPWERPRWEWGRLALSLLHAATHTGRHASMRPVPTGPVHLREQVVDQTVPAEQPCGHI